MSSVNKVIIIGNVGQSPEIRATQNGKKVASFSLATSDVWKDKNTGEKKQSTEWHRVVIFNEGLAGVVERFVKKGSKVYLEGQLKTRKWTDKDGNDKYTTEVFLQGFNSTLTLLDSPNRDGMNQDTGQSNYAQDDFEDEVPF